LVSDFFEWKMSVTGFGKIVVPVASFSVIIVKDVIQLDFGQGACHSDALKLGISLRIRLNMVPNEI